MPLDLSKVNVHWFPSHMAHGLKAMERKLQKATCLIELRDSRIPLSSANPLLSQLVKRTGVRHFVAFNKVDLARSSPLRRVMDDLRSEGIASMALRAAVKEDSQRLRDNLIRYLSDLEHDTAKPIKLMVVGIPNVGKSTLINSIRSISCNTDVKAARTGKKPGVTRLISEQIKISEEPKVYLWDTPGILIPKISDPLVGMRLAATGAILDRQVGEFLIAEFLLDYLKNSKRLSFLLKVQSIPNDINAFLDLYARRLAMVGRGGGANINNAVHSFLSKFRGGQFGKICLDDI